MVKELLDQAQGSLPGCQTLAFVDLSTSMVLVTNTGSSLSQNKLNALVAEARACLMGGHMALVTDADATRYFLRSASDPDEALICVCDASCDMQALISSVQECLAQISGEAEEAA